MKNTMLMLLGGLIFLASCSTGNMASFSKRKYTKGKYKPEKNDYKVAKNANKSEDTKYVVTSEKNKNKQSYKVTKSKVQQKETAIAKNEAPVKKTETVVEETPVYVAENNNANIVVEDGIQEVKTVKANETVLAETAEASTPSAAAAPASAGEILGYIGFAFGLIAVLLAVLGWLTLGLAYGALALGIIGLGVSIASWVIDGQSMWNLWGVITSAVAIALAVVFMILWFIIF